MIVANNNFIVMIFNQKHIYNFIAFSILIGSSSVINNGKHLILITNG